MNRKILIILLLPFFTFSQKTKIVKIVSEQIYTVNGGFNAAFGGKSRIIVPVLIPENTKEWYYVFSANKSKGGINQMKAFTEVARLTDYSGTITNVLSNSIEGLGDAVCDIFILDEDNIRAFEAKKSFSRYLTGSRENIRKGVVKVGDVGCYQSTGNELLDTYNRNNVVKKIFLGIRNPQKYVGIHVTLEVFAVVKEVSKIDTWNVESKNKIYKSLDEFFKKDSEYTPNTTICVCDAIFNKYTQDEFFKLTEDSFKYNKEIIEIFKKCGIKN